MFISFPTSLPKKSAFTIETNALYTSVRLRSLQLAGDGENDKGRFLGHNGLSPAPTLAAQGEGEREMAPSSFQFDKIPMRETAASALACQRFLKSVSRGSAFLPRLTPRKLAC